MSEAASRRHEDSEKHPLFERSCGTELPLSKALHKLQVALVGACNCVYPPRLNLPPPAVGQISFAVCCQHVYLQAIIEARTACSTHRDGMETPGWADHA
jgi:hypothetical protein